MVAATTPPPQSPVTYGSTPPTNQPTTPSPSAVATVSPQAQVGPYQTVPTANSDTPDTLASASVASAPVASATGPSALGASAPAAFGTTSRFSTNSSLSATPPPPVASGRFSGLEDQRVAGLQPTSTMAGSRFSSPPAVASPVAPAFRAGAQYDFCNSRFSQCLLPRAHQSIISQNTVGDPAKRIGNDFITGVITNGPAKPSVA